MASRPAGFTVIKLLVTLVVLSLLSTIAIPIAKVAMQHSREQELRHALHEIRRGIDAYKRASDEGRIPKQTDESGYPKHLNILVEGVPDRHEPTHKKIYFMRRIPRDPMSADTAASAAASWGKRSYASDAAAPREGDDVYDVFSKSPKVGSNGVSYRDW